VKSSPRERAVDGVARLGLRRLKSPNGRMSCVNAYLRPRRRFAHSATANVSRRRRRGARRVAPLAQAPERPQPCATKHCSFRCPPGE